jgi:hypothetical protein
MPSNTLLVIRALAGDASSISVLFKRWIFEERTGTVGKRNGELAEVRWDRGMKQRVELGVFG